MTGVNRIIMPVGKGGRGPGRYSDWGNADLWEECASALKDRIELWGLDSIVWHHVFVHGKQGSVAGNDRVDLIAKYYSMRSEESPPVRRCTRAEYAPLNNILDDTPWVRPSWLGPQPLFWQVGCA